MDITVIPDRQGSKHTRQAIVEAACQYMLLGNMNKVEETTGIPHQTLSTWKTAEWWDKIIGEVRLAKQDEIDSHFGSIIDQAHDVVADRLQNGDERVTAKGEHIRVGVSARDAMTIGAIAFDKQRILRNLPTSISAQGDGLGKLSERLKALESESKAKLISEQ